MPSTYHVVVDTVDLRVGDVGQGALLGEVVLDVVDAQVAELVERPAREAAGELLVPRPDSLLVGGPPDPGAEPRVLEHLGGAGDGEAGRVAGLEGGHEGELLAGGEDVVGDGLGLVPLVVQVGGPGRPEDRGQERAAAQEVAEGAGHGEEVGPAAAAEVVLGARAVPARGGHEHDVVVVGGGLGVVVEVVDDETRALGGDLDVQLEEEGVEGGRDGLGGAQGEEDVAAGVEEVEEELGCQVGAESCCRGDVSLWSSL